MSKSNCFIVHIFNNCEFSGCLHFTTESERLIYPSGLIFTKIPSSRLLLILNKYKLYNPIYILEYNPDNKLNIPVKQTLNSLAGVYLCINLINGKIYVGSAAIKNMYRRYSAHLLKGKGGSLLVKRAVLKYGLENFAFVVIETTKNIKNKAEIISIEQKYIDMLNPKYNIAKIAGSLLNFKWSLESKLRLKKSLKLKTHLENLRILRINRRVSLETRKLLKEKALSRAKITNETRKKMSLNNNKAVKILAYFAKNGEIYQEFVSIAAAAEHFFNDRSRRSPIKYALAKNKLILNKYYLRRYNNIV